MSGCPLCVSSSGVTFCCSKFLAALLGFCSAGVAGKKNWRPCQNSHILTCKSLNFGLRKITGATISPRVVHPFECFVYQLWIFNQIRKSVDFLSRGVQWQPRASCIKSSFSYLFRLLVSKSPRSRITLQCSREAHRSLGLQRKTAFEQCSPAVLHSMKPSLVNDRILLMALL